MDQTDIGRFVLFFERGLLFQENLHLFLRGTKLGGGHMILLRFFRCFLNTGTVAVVIITLWHFTVEFGSTPTQKKRGQSQSKIHRDQHETFI